MSNAYLKQFDTQPTLDVTLKQPNGNAYDPTGGTVKLHIRTVQGLFERAMTIVDGPTGLVRYTGSALDWVNPGEVVLVPGAWRMEYEVTTGAGVIITFPNSGYDTMIVTADLDSEITTPPPIETGAVLLESGQPQNTAISDLTDGAPGQPSDLILISRPGLNRRLTLGDIGFGLQFEEEQITITNAQWLDIHNTHVQVGPTPPVGYFHMPYVVRARKAAGAYVIASGTANLGLFYGATLFASNLVLGPFFTMAAAIRKHRSFVLAEADTDLALNLPMSVGLAAGSQLTGAGGDVDFLVRYMVIEG